MFDKFSEQSARVFLTAEEEAKELGHSYVGTEHFLLAILKLNNKPLSAILERYGLTYECVKNEVISIVGMGMRGLTMSPKITPRAKKVTEIAFEEARKAGSKRVQPEHILLGILREGEGIAKHILKKLNVNIQHLYRELAEGDNFLAQMLVIAQEEARELGHSYVGTEHLLLAILKLNDNPLSAILEYFGLTYTRVKNEVILTEGTDKRRSLVSPQLTMRVREVASIAFEEARKAGSKMVQPEHIFLGILKNGEGIAARILKKLNVEITNVRYEAHELFENNVSKLERFSDRSAQVFVAAREEARDLGHSEVGTEHLLLAIMEVSDKPLSAILEHYGLTYARVKNEIISIVGVSMRGMMVSPGMTQLAKKVTEIAFEEARMVGNDKIEPEHILLGILREREGVAARILNELSTDIPNLQRELLENLGDFKSRKERRELLMFEHEHEHEHLDAFTLMDEDGNEHHFVRLAEVENRGKLYWVCEEIFVNDSEIVDFGETYIFVKTEDEGGNVFLDSIEDEEEFNEIARIWEDMMADEDYFLEDEEVDEEDEESWKN